LVAAHLRPASRNLRITQRVRDTLTPIQTGKNILPN
jgi:hypothetical protein